MTPAVCIDTLARKENISINKKGKTKMGLINPLDQPDNTELKNPQGNGVTDYITKDGTGRHWPYNGYKLSVATSGDIGGGTLTLEVSADGGSNFFLVPNFSQTAIGIKVIDIDYPKGMLFRFVMDGSTDPKLNCYATQNT